MSDKICGAKTRSGKPCKAKAMANGRCYKHGGASTGAGKGNKNALSMASIVASLTRKI